MNRIVFFVLFGFSTFSYSSEVGEWLLISRWVNERPCWSLIKSTNHQEVEKTDPSLTLLEQAVDLFNRRTGSLLVVTEGLVIPVENAEHQELKETSLLGLVKYINQEIKKTTKDQQIVWSYGVGFNKRGRIDGVNYESDIQIIQLRCLQENSKTSSKIPIIDLTKEIAEIFGIKFEESYSEYENVWSQVLGKHLFKEDLKISILPSSNMLHISGSLELPTYFESENSNYEFCLAGALQGLIQVEIASPKK